MQMRDPTLRRLQELQDGKPVQSNLEPSADRLVTVPKPRGGLLLCDETGVSYIRPGQPQKRVAMSPTAIMVSLRSNTGHAWSLMLCDKMQPHQDRSA